MRRQLTHRTSTTHGQGVQRAPYPTIHPLRCHRLSHVALLGASVLLIGGCGAAPRHSMAAPPQTPSSEQAAPGSYVESEPANGQAPQKSNEQAGAAPSSADNTPYATPPASQQPSPAGRGRERTPVWWTQQLQQWEGIAMSSRSSCQQACRALHSMHRAVRALCTTDDQDQDDQQRHLCEDAKTRYEHARVRVQSACGNCRDEVGSD